MKYTKDNHAHIFNTHQHGVSPDTEECRRCGLRRTTVETGSTADTHLMFLEKKAPDGKPTTSTEWAKEIADPFYDEGDPRPYEQLVFNINKLLTTRTDELLGAMKMEYKEEEIAGGIMGKRFSSKKELYNDAVDEFNEKLATLKDKYEK